MWFLEYAGLVKQHNGFVHVCTGSELTGQGKALTRPAGIAEAPMGSQPPAHVYVEEAKRSGAVKTRYGLPASQCAPAVVCLDVGSGYARSCMRTSGTAVLAVLALLCWLTRLR